MNDSGLRLKIELGMEMPDFLVQVWRMLATGQTDEARNALIPVWAYYADAYSMSRERRVALRLFERLGFSTDDQEEWEALPDPFRIYRAGDPGPSWTVNRETAELLRSKIGEGTALRTALIAKADVLAFITCYGEEEVIVRCGGPTEAQVLQA